jgi:dTDP-glucose pyrophosphorylase
MTPRALRTLLVKPDDTFLRALKVIDKGGVEIAFVVDRGRVVGTLTDGDVRRALIKGAALEDRGIRKAMRTRFTSVTRAAPRPEVLDTMRARGISQIPILDRDGKLVGLHLLQELIGASARPNWAVIMAGGQGVRLRPLTEHVPKPMLMVAGRPILERLVLHLVGYGIRELYLSVSYLGDQIKRHFGDGRRFGCRIRYLEEKQPLGTGGPLALLPRRPSHPVLVMNGDLVTEADIDRLLAAHDASGAFATMCVRPHRTEVPFGVAEVRGDRLVGFREKPSDQLLVSAGIYVLSPAAIRRVPRGKPYPITALFEEALAKKRPVGAHVLEGEWMDIGRHEQLRRARGQA